MSVKPISALSARVASRLSALWDQAKAAGSEGQGLGLAVSGGGDSMALLVIAKSWAEAQARPLYVATVNHGLRSEAAAEAEFVAKCCADLDIPHQTFLWTDWQGRGNLQDAARRARQRLLRGWASELGLAAIATGHTQDDQAETLLLRLARGSGVDGLAAMAELRRDEAGFAWIRPMLGEGRQALREELETRGQNWCEDPSNEDPRFDRVRARKMLTELSGLGMSAQILADTAARMAAARQVLGQAANRAAADLVHCALGQLTIAVADFWRLPDDTRWRLLSQALCTVSGNPYRPNLSALRGAEEALRAGRAHTLHGCYLTSGVALCVHREAAAISTLRSAAPGLWDGWKVTGPKVQNAEIRILGESGLAQTSDWRASGLPFRAALATPGIWHGDELLGSPALNLGEWTARTLWDKTSFTASLLSH